MLLLHSHQFRPLVFTQMVKLFVQSTDFQLRLQIHFVTLQRHFRVLTKFAHVESRLSGRKLQRKVVFYAPANLCDRRPCSTSVAVGVIMGRVEPILRRLAILRHHNDGRL